MASFIEYLRVRGGLVKFMYYSIAGESRSDKPVAKDEPKPMPNDWQDVHAVWENIPAQVISDPEKIAEKHNEIMLRPVTASWKAYMVMKEIHGVDLINTPDLSSEDKVLVDPVTKYIEDPDLKNQYFIRIPITKNRPRFKR